MKARNMTKKLTTAIATQMVDRIEALQDQINAIYREADDYNGNRNSALIRDAWKARQVMREEQFNESALLASCDCVDEKSGSTEQQSAM